MLIKIFIITLLSISSAFAQPFASTPQELIVTFYEQLGSDKPSKELAQIFEPDSARGFAAALPSSTKKSRTEPAAATTAVWDYFRANKNIFLSEFVDPSRAKEWVQLRYCFAAFPHPETFFDGVLFVEQKIGVSKRNKEGVLKTISFPIAKAHSPEYGNYYLINVCAIAVNGISLDPSNEYDRSENLYQLLGFPVKPDAKKK